MVTGSDVTCHGKRLSVSASGETAANTSAPTQFQRVGEGTYAYRRFGVPSARPLLLFQHFMGTLDNWDYAVTDALALKREVILFDNVDVDRLSALNPSAVVTGHKDPAQGNPPTVIDESRTYIEFYNRRRDAGLSDQELVDAMVMRFPDWISPQALLILPSVEGPSTRART